VEVVNSIRCIKITSADNVLKIRFNKTNIFNPISVFLYVRYNSKIGSILILGIFIISVYCGFNIY